MRCRFIQLSVAAIVICCSLSACTLEEIIAGFLINTKSCPIRLMIDGVEYSDDEYTFINLGRDHPHMYNRTFEGEFYVTISRTVSSDKGDTVDVFIRIREPGDLEIGKKYILSPENSNKTGIHFYMDNTEYRYNLTDGQLVFTQFIVGEYISGEFEFTASEKNSGDIIHITNGTFEHLPI